MPTTLDRIYQVGKITGKSFYLKRPESKSSSELKGLFADIGIKIHEEGKTSVDLVRELRETK